MKNKGYIAPKLRKSKFTCPHCNVVAKQTWNSCKFFDTMDGFTKDVDYADISDGIKVSVSTCQCCSNPHVWVEDKMVQPINYNIAVANEGMPYNIKKIYDEAREVFHISAKAAAALLRLALQHLCIELGGKGKNINEDIGNMVKDGLPVKIQKSLDIVRVVGNNAVHPGELNLDDNTEIARALFDIINIIVDNRIVQTKKINELYNSLPKKVLVAIEERDNK